MVVIQRNPIYSAVFLVLNLACVAVFYLLLNAEFLFAVQIIVYAGAIMVLFLFVITLLAPGKEETRDDPLVRHPLACRGTRRHHGGGLVLESLLPIRSVACW